MAAGRKIRIKLESETSELYVEIKETDKVKDLSKIIQRAWGADDYFTFHHHGTEMQTDQPLSAYNVTDGSVIKLKVFAESPSGFASRIQKCRGKNEFNVVDKRTAGQGV